MDLVTMAMAQAIAKNYTDAQLADLGFTNLSYHFCTTGEYNATSKQPTISSPDANTFYFTPGSTNELFNVYYNKGSGWIKFTTVSVDLSVIPTDDTLSKSGFAADSKTVGDEISHLRDNLNRLNDGGLILKDDVIAENVTNWLDEHPEATTTVQDGSLTESKFTDSLKLKTINNYVTPEMFGAVGDGVTDDTQAFIDCFNSGKPIHLMPNKTYLGGTVNLPDKYEKIYINGNNSILKYFGFIFNVNTTTNKWIHEFPAVNSIIENVKFECKENTTTLWLGMGIKLNNIVFNNPTTAVKFVANYLDYICMDNISLAGSTSNNELPIFQLPYIGDMHSFKNVHNYMTAKANYDFDVHNDNVVTFDQCVNISINVANKGCVVIRDCHIEHGNISVVNGASVDCYNCYFWGFTYVNEKVKYHECVWIFNPDSVTLSVSTDANGFNEILNNCDECIMKFANVGLDFIIFNKIDKNLMDIKCSTVVTGAQCWWISQSGGGTTDLNGEYTYTMFGSNSKDVFAGTQKSNFTTKTITLNNKVCRFLMDTTRYTFIWRKAPDGTIKKCVIPPNNTDKQAVDIGGTINGFKWEDADSVPTKDDITNNWAKWTGDMWNMEPGQVINGSTLYANSDGVIKIKSAT